MWWTRVAAINAYWLAAGLARYSAIMAATALPPSTASDPPSQKSRCTSTTSNARLAWPDGGMFAPGPASSLGTSADYVYADVCTDGPGSESSGDACPGSV